MTAFIDPPARIPFWLKIGISISERITGKIMLPARILAWYPRAAVGSGILETLVAHEDGQMDKRILKLIRMTASFAAACPFCIDMNSFEYQECGISDEEAAVLCPSMRNPNLFPLFQSVSGWQLFTAVSSRKRRSLSSDVVERVKSVFSEREMVILSSTAAQVNYWARLIQGWRFRLPGITMRVKWNLRAWSVAKHPRTGPGLTVIF